MTKIIATVEYRSRGWNGLEFLPGMNYRIVVVCENPSTLLAKTYAFTETGAQRKAARLAQREVSRARKAKTVRTYDV